MKIKVNEGYAPAEILSYRNYHLAVWDLETVEEKSGLEAPRHGINTEATLHLLSIAVGSNIPNMETKCWVRKSSDPKHAAQLIKNLVVYLKKLQEERKKLLPDYILEAEMKIEAVCEKIKFHIVCGDKSRNLEFCRLRSYLRALENLTKLSVYGFNSSRFDCPVIAGDLFVLLKKLDGNVSILKKGASYFQIASDSLIFKDVLSLTAPCRLDKFLTNWESDVKKSIWPYSRYTCIEEIRAEKNFPKRSAFFSDLTRDTVSMEDYISAKGEFMRRRLLPKSHPDKIFNMVGWLKFYNVLDVAPLAQALEKCFRSYNENFDVDALTASSLPALAAEAMFKNFHPNSPLFYSIPDEFKDVNQIFRSNVIGGLVCAYQRHATTNFDPKLPHRACFNANGEPIKTVLFLDFTSMYLSCQDKPMPTTPGIVWTPGVNNRWRKNVMADSHSFEAQQWLSYVQYADEHLKNKNGSRAMIQSLYFRGEVKVPKSDGSGDWLVDGYADTEYGHRFYEYNGCKFHDVCPHCDPHGKDPINDRKIADLEQYGTVIVIWGCVWKEILKQVKNTPTKIMPLILQDTHTIDEILQSIMDEKLFGFILCDIETPEHLQAEMKNFPPLIKREVITDEYLSEYMAERFEKRYPGKKLKQETVIQCFNAKNHLLLTSLVKFYLEIGLKVTKIHRVIQYRPYRSLSPFVKHVTAMRLAAEKAKKKTKANTAKTFGNAGYGKVRFKQSKNN